MKTGWATVKLGDLVAFKTGKLDSNAAVPDGDYPFFTCSQETLRTNTYSFDTECVLLAGNNANGIYPLKYFRGKFDAYQRTYVITTRDPRRLATRFLYYALRPKLSEFRSVSTGAATKFLTLTILNQTQITVPPLQAQSQITSILSAYDDLIENNTRRIENLEQMAQALYREWFVKFRFPGHTKCRCVASPLGHIPQGWRVMRLEELTSYLNRGMAPSYAENGSLVINQKCIRNGRVNLGLARHQSKPIPPEKLVRVGDVLINSTGEGTLGRVAQVCDYVESCTVDTHVTIVRPRAGVDLDFFGLTLILKEDVFMKMGVGSTGQTEFSRQAIGNIPIIVAPSAQQAAFGELVGPMRKLVSNMEQRNANLRRTRDLLLPKLISGTLDVSKLDIETA